MKTVTFNDQIDWLYQIILIIIPAALLLPSLSFGLYYQWDDAYFLMNNRMGFSFDNVVYWLTHPTMAVYTPATMFSFMFDFSLWGVNPALSRFINILLHCLSVWLLYRLMLLIGVKRIVAFLFTLAFAVNPQRVESVVWIAERKDVLCAAAYFGALICFIQGCRRDRISIGSLVLLVVALGAKPMAFPLPLLFAVYAVHHYRSFSIKPYLKILWPGILITVCASLVFWRFSTDDIIPLTFPHNLLVALHNICWFMATAILPVEVCPIYPLVRFSLGTIFMMIVVLSLSSSLLYYLWRRYNGKIMFYDILPFTTAYLFSLIPVFGILMVSSTNYCDRYNYIPAGILLTGLGLLVTKNSIRIKSVMIHRIVRLAIPIYLSYLAMLTVMYLPAWSSSYAIFKASLKYKYPNLKVLLAIAGNGLSEQRPDRVIEGGRLLLDHSLYMPGKPLPLTSQEGMTMYNTALGIFGTGYQQLGFNQRALVFLREFDRIRQQGKIRLYMGPLVMKNSYNALAHCYLARGQRLKAMEALRTAREEMVAKSPDHNLYSGIIQYLSGNYTSAMRYFGTILMHNNADDIARHNFTEASEKHQNRLPPDTAAIKLRTNL